TLGKAHRRKGSEPTSTSLSKKELRHVFEHWHIKEQWQSFTTIVHPRQVSHNFTTKENPTDYQKSKYIL
ncbi:hypothetical protein BHE74_00015353, partial [Ensete ventricosum]